MLEKIATEGKLLARLTNGNIQYATRVQSKSDQEFINSWQEFESEEQAKEALNKEYT